MQSKRKPATPEYYNHFINMSKDEMTTVITHILHNSRHNLYKIWFDKNISDETKFSKIYDLISFWLLCFAHGFIGFKKNGKMCFFNPVGEDTDKENSRMILKKIQESAPLMILLLAQDRLEQLKRRL